MREFEQQLKAELAQVQAQALFRQVRWIDSPQGRWIQVEGRAFLNFSSNDYLGLANHPVIKAASKEAIDEYGAGSGSARLICGSLRPHQEVEMALAEFKGTEAALTFSSGYLTALGTISALVSKEDVLVLDRLVHACIVDAARLSGARLRVFAHNDLEALERILQWAATRRMARVPSRPARILIVTESVFSMDGDRAPLQELIRLKDHYGAWLMLDEAHATGLLGPQGRGLAHALGAAARVEIQMGTLGKALGAAGGYICGSRSLIDLLTNRARTFLFSTAPVPAAAAAARSAIALVQSPQGEQRRAVLWQRVKELAESQPGAFPPRSSGPSSAILPWIIGQEADALRAATDLARSGIFVPAIRYPTVRKGQARLRFTVTAEHTRDDIARVSGAMRGLL